LLDWASTSGGRAGSGSGVAIGVRSRGTGVISAVAVGARTGIRGGVGAGVAGLQAGSASSARLATSQRAGIRLMGHSPSAGP